MREKLWIKLAWFIPKKLTYWASIRLMVNATVGEYSSQDVAALTCADALQRWE